MRVDQVVQGASGVQPFLQCSPRGLQHLEHHVVAARPTHVRLNKAREVVGGAHTAEFVAGMLTDAGGQPPSQRLDCAFVLRRVVGHRIKIVPGSVIQ